MWRADDGTVNAWENRVPAPRRAALRRDQSRRPAQVPVPRLDVRVGSGSASSGGPSGREAPVPRPGAPVPCVEVEGYVWVRLAGEGDDGAGTGSDPAPGFGPGSTPAGLTLRSIHVFAPAAAVAGALARHAGEAPDGPPATVVDPYVVDPYTVRSARAEAGEIRYALQPVSDTETVIHAALADTPPAAERIAVLRRENGRLRAVRDAIEAEEAP